MNQDQVVAFALPMWNPPGVAGRSILMSLIVFLRCESPDMTAMEAEPVLDLPLHRLVAWEFRGAESCMTVANRLGGQLLDAHTVMTLIGPGVPEERTPLLALFGTRYAPRDPVERGHRRVAHRG